MGKSKKLSDKSNLLKTQKDNHITKSPKESHFSTDKSKGNLLQIWKWSEIIRWDKFLKKII